MSLGPLSSVPPRHTGLSTLPFSTEVFSPIPRKSSLADCLTEQGSQSKQASLYPKGARVPSLVGKTPSQPFDQQCLLVPQSPETGLSPEARACFPLRRKWVNLAEGARQNKSIPSCSSLWLTTGSIHLPFRGRPAGQEKYEKTQPARPGH